MGKGKGGKKKPGETAIDVEVIPMPPPKKSGRQEVQGGSSGPRPVDPAPRTKEDDPTGTL